MKKLSLAVLGACAGIAFCGPAMADPPNRDGAKFRVDRDRGEFRGDRRTGGDVRIERRGNPDWRRTVDRDRVRRGHRYLWAPGVAFYFSDGYYYGECGWLKLRAQETGSRIWWRRYERCRDFS